MMNKPLLAFVETTTEMKNSFEPSRPYRFDIFKGEKDEAGKQLPYFGPEVYYDVLTSAGTYCTYVLLYVYCTCVSLFSFTRT